MLALGTGIGSSLGARELCILMIADDETILCEVVVDPSAELSVLASAKDSLDLT
jgi:hypothetical protein